jgi:hypothetical protein
MPCMHHHVVPGLCRRPKPTRSAFVWPWKMGPRSVEEDEEEAKGKANGREGGGNNGEEEGTTTPAG